VAVFVTIGGQLTASPVAADTYDAGPCATASSSASMLPPGEPGTSLVVHGRVVQPDGRTPAAGVIVYAYQTDARGYYNEARDAPPRLRAWVKTDARGEFTLRTVRPGQYPGRSVPAHVHFQAWGHGYEPQWTTELLFGDDPTIGERQRADSAALGEFGFIHDAKNAAGGGLEVSHAIRLKPRGDAFDPRIRHGLQACESRASR
jgi:protocatechuate 3,4-dioxygenase beta subunit